MPILSLFYQESRKREEILPPSLNALEPIAQQIVSLPPSLRVALPASFALGALSMWGGSIAYKRYFKRIKNVEWITPDVYRRKQWLKGRVVRFVVRIVGCSTLLLT